MVFYTELKRRRTQYYIGRTISVMQVRTGVSLVKRLKTLVLAFIYYWGVVFEEITHTIDYLSVCRSSVSRLPAAIYTRWIRKNAETRYSTFDRTSLFISAFLLYLLLRPNCFASLWAIRKSTTVPCVSAACGNLHEKNSQERWNEVFDVRRYLTVYPGKNFYSD
jgi:hypothetical protein